MRLYFELTQMEQSVIATLMAACEEDGVVWEVGCDRFSVEDDPAGMLILDTSSKTMRWDEWGIDARTFMHLADRLSGRWLDKATMGGTA